MPSPCHHLVNSPPPTSFPGSVSIGGPIESVTGFPRRSARLLNKPRTDYFHLKKPGSWIGCRTVVSDPSQSQGQHRPITLPPSGPQVSLGSAFDYLREEDLIRPGCPISDSRPEDRTTGRNLAIHPLSHPLSSAPQEEGVHRFEDGHLWVPSTMSEETDPTINIPINLEL